ncbi:MAG TPA: DegT/DnrJ/EryC1/StrS family aminotransferase [Armatimonadota bacterium]|nr:DegT/DnrJ/EryC1/StrS family aminotransferase [Armatimonadota bacterium]
MTAVMSPTATRPLAICGGERLIPRGTILPSPPTTALDEQMVLDSLRSGSHTWGPHTEALQEEWKQWNGNLHCIAVNSGTSALHLCLAAVNMSAGDEVITPAYSWTSSASCILHHNGIPVFADIEPVYANLDPAKVEAAITPRTRAIIVVHLHGVPADIAPIQEIARRHGIAVIEDCCQAHGAKYYGRKVGTLADCAAFSLNQNKMLSSGEGGFFVTDDEVNAERARSLALFGDFRRPVEDPEYHSYGLGWMYRFNELSAAYARAQLTRLDESIEHSRSLFAILRKDLAGLPGLILASEPAWASENGYNFVCHVDPTAVGYEGPADHFREAIVRALQAEGVPASVWQRRILPEFSAIAARNAYGNGSPWREHGSEVSYDPGQYPNALYHSATYFILSGLRLPNTEDTARLIAAGVRRVFENLDQLDIDELARGADISLYERGWRPHAVS